MNRYKKYFYRHSYKTILINILLLAILLLAIIYWININRVEEHEVVLVEDGDTFKLDNGETVRYIGIDTPEITIIEHPQCFGNEATEANRAMIEGKTIKLKRDIKNRDIYGRLLRYVYVDNKFINEELIKNGYARLMTVYPNVSFSREFKMAEKNAQKNKIGLWSENNCNGGR